MTQYSDFTPSVLNMYVQQYGCKILNPLGDAQINEIEKKVGDLPKELRSFYSLVNGLEADGFRVFPICDPQNLKATWDSLERENNIVTTKFSLDEDLLKRFIVFSEIGGLHCGMYDRNDSSIWYEDDEGYHRTSLKLKEFIELNLKANN